jgi:hypothetical protein
MDDTSSKSSLGRSSVGSGGSLGQDR